LAPRCARVLVEPVGLDEAEALSLAAEIEAILLAAKIPNEQVHHGANHATWAVQRRAAAHGHGLRTGLEDTTVLPDGSPAKGNAELVSESRRLLASAALEEAR